jgi:hypothetical protein
MHVNVLCVKLSTLKKGFMIFMLLYKQEQPEAFIGRAFFKSFMACTLANNGVCAAWCRDGPPAWGGGG